MIFASGSALRSRATPASLTPVRKSTSIRRLPHRSSTATASSVSDVSASASSASRSSRASDASPASVTRVSVRESFRSAGNVASTATVRSPTAVCVRSTTSSAASGPAACPDRSASQTMSSSATRVWARSIRVIPSPRPSSGPAGATVALPPSRSTARTMAFVADRSAAAPQPPIPTRTQPARTATDIMPTLTAPGARAGANDPTRCAMRMTPSGDRLDLHSPRPARSRGTLVRG